ncbi:unnamed protein product [Chrysodeixis includens]|uniref:Pre-mRNA-processing factor 39 n=1 Tax=Chrysodeixis includens TaxID=689277 RepID=A0A9P0BT47_CHRIL|nr:unnamed protein product [Chrysodeixis includens]
MDDEASSDLQKCLSDGPMDTDEGPLINENSNGLSHLLTEGEFNSVEAAVDESSTSNQESQKATVDTDFEVSEISDAGYSMPADDMTQTKTDGSAGDAAESVGIKVEKEAMETPPEKMEESSNDEQITISIKEEAFYQNNTQDVKNEKHDSEDRKQDIKDIPKAVIKTDIDVKEEHAVKTEVKLENAAETGAVVKEETATPTKKSNKVVSEDELPSSKKESKESRKRKTEDDPDGYDPGSPTSESETTNKKQAVAKNGESKPIPAEKRTSIDEKPKKKTLPELDKYWKVVNDDPTDFTGWTYLLQYVDQESDVEAAREAYDAFLSHYPYCYGYWRKYADYEKRKGSKKKCLEVLERGLKAIPLSVDLWIHFLNHVKATRTEDHAFIRSQYERAIEACGLEFRSDRLWESYIKWEAENGSALNVTNIYDRLLATPTLGYTSHFDNFQEHVMSEPVAGVVSRAELVRLRGEVREAAGAAPQLDLPPGEDEPLDHVASEEEAQAIKERVIAARRKVHKTTGEQVAARWTFEEGIKRPYFHVKPLERCQLKNWKSYLEWEKQHGSLKRALVLHERCLIACALYEEFWMRLIKFLEERVEAHPELVGVQREVLERACTVHHHDKPELHLHWAHFEEAHGCPARAADILDRIEKACPCLVQIQYRCLQTMRVNLERRRGDYEKCVQLYEGYIASAKNKSVASALSIKYARFLFHVRRDPAAARAALDAAVLRDPLNPRLHAQRLDLALHTPDTPYSELDELVSSYEQQEGAELETSAMMAWRRRELAEELGDPAAARAAHAHARALAKHLRKRARKDKHDPPPPPSNATVDCTKKKECTVATTSCTPTASSGNSYYQAPAAAASYEQSYAQPYQPAWGYQQPPGPYQHHPHPWPQYPNYY